MVDQRMTVEPLCCVCVWGGGGRCFPPPPTTGLVVNSFIITNPTLAGERMLLIPKVSILSEQRPKLTTLVGKGASKLHDLLDSHHRANGKGVNISVGESSQIEGLECCL